MYYNNLFTFAIAITIAIMPFYTTLFYGWKFNKLDDEEFASKFGTLYSGLNLDMAEHTRRNGLFFPFFFILRRLLFVFAAIYMESFLWLQLAIQFFCSVWMMIYLLTFWPFKDKIFTKVEVMNEVTSLLLLYHMLTFTDWVPRAETRYVMGWSFIGITSGNLAIHMLLLIRNSINDIKSKCEIKFHLSIQMKSKKKKELAK